MFEGVSPPVLLVWGSAAVVIVGVTGHRFWLFLAGRRDWVNRYACGAGLLAALFLLTRFPSPVRYYLDGLLPWVALSGANYSLVIWIVYALFMITHHVYKLPRWHAWVGLALAAAVQVGTLLALVQSSSPDRLSLSGSARRGSVGARLYLVLMILYCSVGAVYVAAQLLRLAGQTRRREVRIGQVVAAVGLLVLTLAAVEETVFLFSQMLMKTHGRLINALVPPGILCLASGVLVFSPPGQWLADVGRYIRLRPLGQAIARSWPEVCMEEYAWWTILDLPRIRQRLYRVVVEWQDLRRLLTVYLPDEAVPGGAAPDAVAEAAYLARGLQRGSLVAREEGADPGRLPPVPDGLDEASRLLLGVQKEMRAW